MPLLGKVPDVTSRYYLRLFFNCDASQIQFYADEPYTTIQKYVEKGFGQSLKGYGSWSGLYAADDEA